MSKPGEYASPRPQLTPREIAARKRRIANAVIAGNSLSEVGRLYGMKGDTVAIICDELGVPRPRVGGKSVL